MENYTIEFVEDEVPSNDPTISSRHLGSVPVLSESQAIPRTTANIYAPQTIDRDQLPGNSMFPLTGMIDLQESSRTSSNIMRTHSRGKRVRFSSFRSNRGFCDITETAEWITEDFTQNPPAVPPSRNLRSLVSASVPETYGNLDVSVANPPAPLNIQPYANLMKLLIEILERVNRDLDSVQGINDKIVIQFLQKKLSQYRQWRNEDEQELMRFLNELS